MHFGSGVLECRRIWGIRVLVVLQGGRHRRVNGQGLLPQSILQLATRHLVWSNLDHAIFFVGGGVSRSIVLRRLRNVRVPRKFEGPIHGRLCKLVTYLLLEFDQLFFDLLIHVARLLQRPASQGGDVTVCEDCLVLGLLDTS